VVIQNRRPQEPSNNKVERNECQQSGLPISEH